MAWDNYCGKAADMAAQKGYGCIGAAWGIRQYHLSLSIIGLGGVKLRDKAFKYDITYFYHNLISINYYYYLILSKFNY